MLDKRNFYINGKWVSKPSKPNDFEVINPSNEEPFAIISLGDAKEDTNCCSRKLPKKLLLNGKKLRKKKE